jgi:signal transduction histidine kinase
MPEERVETTLPDKVAAMAPFKRRRQLERDLEHITEEMYRRNRELAETNKMLSLLGTIDALALESHTSLKMVCEHVTEAVAQTTNYDFVGLLVRSTRTPELLTLMGWSGNDWLGKDASLGSGRTLHVPLTHDWLRAPEEEARLVNLEELTNQTLAALFDCKPAEVEALKRQLPLKSVYAIKLVARRRLVGLLVVGFFTPLAALPANGVKLLDRLSETIGVAIDNKLLFEENQHVLRQLKESNTKLRALDEAKDDFISMASHQLRTPLTSVKGYLSMVIDGDTGKITPMQQQMLKQAFFSSQRMVYLIADLLNVSRLRTGKFVIEPAPVDMAAVVGEEVEQLQETAKSRNLKLTYEKPTSFPELMLDETKTRQVVMNFIDNAIYYTPTGGRIKVRLLNKEQTVELRVEDNGMGVPKSE